MLTLNTRGRSHQTQKCNQNKFPFESIFILKSNLVYNQDVGETMILAFLKTKKTKHFFLNNSAKSQFPWKYVYEQGF